MKAKNYIRIIAMMMFAGLTANMGDLMAQPRPIVEYNFQFSARINRFHKTYTTFTYYSPVFTETYWYTFAPLSWGISIYGNNVINVGLTGYPIFEVAYCNYIDFTPYYYTPIVINVGHKPAPLRHVGWLKPAPAHHIAWLKPAPKPSIFHLDRPIYRYAVAPKPHPLPQPKYEPKPQPKYEPQPQPKYAPQPKMEARTQTPRQDIHAGKMAENERTQAPAQANNSRRAEVTTTAPTVRNTTKPTETRKESAAPTRQGQATNRTTNATAKPQENRANGTQATPQNRQNTQQRATTNNATQRAASNGATQQNRTATQSQPAQRQATRTPAEQNRKATPATNKRQVVAVKAETSQQRQATTTTQRQATTQRAAGNGETAQARRTVAKNNTAPKVAANNGNERKSAATAQTQRTTVNANSDKRNVVAANNGRR